MTIHSQIRFQLGFTAVAALQLNSLVSGVESVRQDVSNLMGAVSGDIHFQERLQHELTQHGILEKDMQGKLAEMEQSMYINTLNQVHQQTHYDSLTNELMRLNTENSALQTALSSMHEQAMGYKDCAHGSTYARGWGTEHQINRGRRHVREESNLSQRLQASEMRIDQARVQVEVLQLQLQHMQGELNEFASLAMTRERLEQKVVWQAWKKSMLGTDARNSPWAQGRTSVLLGPASFLRAWDLPNRKIHSQSPPLQSTANNFLPDMSSAGILMGSHKSLSQSPVVHVASPSLHSPKFASPMLAWGRKEMLTKVAGAPEGRQELPKTQVERTSRYHVPHKIGAIKKDKVELNTFNLGLERDLQESMSWVELRRENLLLGTELQDSLSSDCISGMTPVTWHVEPAQECSRTQIQSPAPAQSFVAREQVVLIETRLQQELEQANKARDELLETIQLQSDEILNLHGRMLNDTRDEIEQSLIARDDLLW